MESVLEQRLFRLLRRAGLPPPAAQHEVRAGDKIVARLDFAYPELRVGIETHGYRWHGGREQWQRDMRRENELKQLGWTVLVFGWEDVHREPERVIRQVRALCTAVLQDQTEIRSDLGKPAEGAAT
jgi:very-short-patch-repair endonuclease